MRRQTDGGGGQARAMSAPGGRRPPVALIHTNNSPKPASMRVSARLERSEGLSFWEIRQAMEVLSGPIGWLMASRAGEGAYGAKSTR